MYLSERFFDCLKCLPFFVPWLGEAGESFGWFASGGAGQLFGCCSAAGCSVTCPGEMSWYRYRSRGTCGLVDSVKSEGWKLAMSLRRLCDKWLWKFKLRWNMETIWQGDVVVLSPCGWPQFSLRYVGYVLWIMSQMSRVVGDAKPAAPFELGTRGLADIQFFGQLLGGSLGVHNEIIDGMTRNGQTWSYQLQLSNRIMVRRHPPTWFCLGCWSQHRTGHAMVNETNISRSGRSCMKSGIWKNLFVLAIPTL